MTDFNEAGQSFAQQVTAVQQHMDQLTLIARSSSQQPAHLLTECIEELRVTLEELQVSEEELLQQNQELLIAREAIEAERQRYQNLFEFAPDGYLTTDANGLILEANQRMGFLLHIPIRYLIGKPLVSFVAEGQRREFRSLLNQLPSLKRLQEWEICLCTRGGTVVETALTVETVRDDGGGRDREGNPRLIALRWLIRDITERKQAEGQLRQAQLHNLELVESDRLKSQFLATLSHELRTPLQAILGFSHVLLRKQQTQDDARQTSMLERILRNGQHLLAMIEEMLDYTRLKANRLDLNPESFDLVQLAIATVEDLRCLAEQKGLYLEIDLEQSLLPVLIDRNRVRQTIVNLISNAIKFTDEGGVWLSLQGLPDQRVAIVVSDTGIGIDPADQKQIFQEFRQLNQSNTRLHGGTGLGLAITKALVELMQGTMSVESQLGQGTSFRVELPQRAQQN